MPRPIASAAPRGVLPPKFEVQRSTFKVRPGFTLIELLVVIAIIAILAAIAFPVFQSVIGKARKADALSTINTVRTALTAYQTEYNDWPPALLSLGSNSTDARIDADLTYASPGKWRDIYYALTATGDSNVVATNNKRRMVFVTFSPKQLDDASSPTNSTTFLDPWRREFSIIVDSNGDNVLEGVPNVAASTGNISIHGNMAMWSYGPEPTNRKQWVVSWK